MTLTQLAELEMQAHDVLRYRPGGTRMSIQPETVLDMIRLIRLGADLALDVAAGAA